jgi:hypothetical protein
MLTEQKANGRFIYIQLCIDVVHESHKTVRKSIGNVRRVQMKNFVRQYVAVQLVILTPTPTNGFVYLISFIFASTLKIWLFMS